MLTNKYSEGYPHRRYYGGNRVDRRGRGPRARRGSPRCSARTTRTSSRMPVPARTSPSTRRSSSPATPCSPCGSTTAGTSRTARPRRSPRKIWRFVSYGVDAARRSTGPTRASGSTSTRCATAPRPSGRSSSSRARPRTRGSSTPSRSARSPTRWGRCSCSTWPTSPASSPAGCTRTPSRSPTSSRSRPTRRCAARAAGAIVCREEHAKAIDSAVFPGLQGGPLEHVIAAKAVAFHEAATPGVRAATRATSSRNAAALAAGLVVRGVPARHRGHRQPPRARRPARLRRRSSPARRPRRSSTVAGITLNRNQIPDDPRSPFVTSGLRLGSAAETTAGMGPDEMGADRLADRDRSLRHRGDEAAQAAVRTEVRDAVRRVPPVPRGGARRPDGRARLVRPHRGDRRVDRVRAHRPRPGRSRARWGTCAVPSDRSVHSRTTPYGGGVAMFSGLCVAIGLGGVRPRAAHRCTCDTNELVGVVLACGVILVVGLVDDLRSMSAPAKVAGAGPRRVRPVLRRGDHGAAQDPVLRRARARTGHPAAHHRAVGHRDHERDQPHRRTRRAGRRDRRVSPRARSASTGCASSTSVCSP